jgi:hypothetical protein
LASNPALRFLDFTNKPWGFDGRFRTVKNFSLLSFGRAELRVASAILMRLAGLSPFSGFAQRNLLKFGKADAKVFTTAKAGWRARFQEVQGRATLDAGRWLGGQGDVQIVQHGLDVFLRLVVARQYQPAPIDHRNPDLHHLDRRQLFQLPPTSVPTMC